MAKANDFCRSYRRFQFHISKIRFIMIRGQQVMLDADLAELYHVQTKRINEAEIQNVFQKSFCF